MLGSYVNTSLGVNNNTRTLFWATNYPTDSNVTIDGFKITWGGEYYIKSCFTKSVFLGPVSITLLQLTVHLDLGNRVFVTIT